MSDSNEKYSMKLKFFYFFHTLWCRSNTWETKVGAFLSFWTTRPSKCYKSQLTTNTSTNIDSPSEVIKEQYMLWKKNIFLEASSLVIVITLNFSTYCASVNMDPKCFQQWLSSNLKNGMGKRWTSASSKCLQVAYFKGWLLPAKAR